MSTLVLESMQWTDLHHIADLRPIDESDAQCLEEVRLVLQKHNALDRFGVALLHSHFDLASDEMMLETTDAERREHLVRPVKRSYPEEHGFTAQTTIVSFDEDGYSQTLAPAATITSRQQIGSVRARRLRGRRRVVRV